MKAKCIMQFKQLEGVIDIGDEVDIEAILTKEDVHIQKRVWSKEKDKYGNRSSQIVIERTIPAGSYAGYRIITKSGLVYDDKCIFNMIGYKTLADIFSKN